LASNAREEADKAKQEATEDKTKRDQDYRNAADEVKPLVADEASKKEAYEEAQAATEKASVNAAILKQKHAFAQKLRDRANSALEAATEDAKKLAQDAKAAQGTLTALSAEQVPSSLEVVELGSED